ncbi:uncharacterized protein PpBr36_09655, partial [Pyricularia pennisetigena]|uniref:uncharacterized protein n=1 Tax=Pyricularia pennisetigena TaxID=1578925 RepID=UPI001153056A
WPGFGSGSGSGSRSRCGLGCTLTCYCFVRSNTVLHTKRDIDLCSLRCRLRRLCRVRRCTGIYRIILRCYSTIRGDALVDRCGCSRISFEEDNSE